MTEMGEQFYTESGDLFKLVGVLRATDIYWNPAKRWLILKLKIRFHIYTPLILENRNVSSGDPF
jgi:hypothetical protein